MDKLYCLSVSYIMDCGSCTRSTFTNSASTEAVEVGLTRGTCVAAVFRMGKPSTKKYRNYCVVVFTSCVRGGENETLHEVVH